MPITWTKINNLEYAHIPVGRNIDILTVRDNVKNAFFFSLTDMYEGIGYTRSTFQKALQSGYKRYFRPVYFSHFPDHCFASVKGVTSFVSLISTRRYSNKSKTDLREMAIRLMKNHVSEYRTGIKKNGSVKQSLFESHIIYNRKPISFVYVDGKMMLNFRDMSESLGYKRDSSPASVYLTYGVLMTFHGKKSRYIPVKNIPAIASQLSYSDKLMEIYALSCSVSRNNSASSGKDMVIYKNQGVAIYKTKALIPIKVIDGEVHFHLSSLSKAVGLNRTSKALSQLSVNTDDGYYVEKSAIELFIDEGSMPQIIRNSWKDFSQSLS